MYQDHFKLHRAPFAVTPDPEFLYESAHHREALAQLRYGLHEHRGLLTLVGEVGTGKSTLLRALIDGLEGTQTILITHTTLDREDLMRMVMHELHIEDSGLTRVEMLAKLTEFVTAEAKADRPPPVLIVDEAHNLSEEVLEEIRLLTNLEHSQNKLLQVVLAGQPELDRTLAKLELRQLQQRVAVRARLAPLDLDETSEYIAHRLRTAGARNADLFTREAVETIWAATGGTPRFINNVCDQCLINAYGTKRNTVGRQLAREAVKDLDLELLPQLASGATQVPVHVPTTEIVPAGHEQDEEADEETALRTVVAAVPVPPDATDNNDNGNRGAAWVYATLGVAVLSLGVLFWYFLAGNGPGTAGPTATAANPSSPAPSEPASEPAVTTVASVSSALPLVPEEDPNVLVNTGPDARLDLPPQDNQPRQPRDRDRTQTPVVRTQLLSGPQTQRAPAPSTASSPSPSGTAQPTQDANATPPPNAAVDVASGDRTATQTAPDPNAALETSQGSAGDPANAAPANEVQANEVPTGTASPTTDTSGNDGSLGSGPDPGTDPGTEPGTVPADIVGGSPTSTYQAPQPLVRVQPTFPPLARQRRVDGTVRVWILVDDQGIPAQSILDSDSINPLLGEAALAAANQWRFAPAEADGAAVQAWTSVDFEFQDASAQLRADSPATASTPISVPAQPPATGNTANANPPAGTPADPVDSPTPAPVVPINYQSAQPIQQVEPNYPPLARRLRIQATIEVRVQVDEQGNVTDATIDKGTNPLLSEAALEAARQWRFQPARRDGQPVASSTLVTFRFNGS